MVYRAVSLVLAFILGSFAAAQTPVDSMSEADLLEGQKLFRVHCARCHGMEGGGGEGSNLARPRLKYAPDDQALFDLLEEGIGGTGMPAFWVLDEPRRWQVIAYVRSLRERIAVEMPGDSARGEQIYKGKGGCPVCHIVSGTGRGIGPELTEIGDQRGVEYLRASLVAPEEAQPNTAGFADYLSVRAVTEHGQVEGLRINEDAFSIQIRDLAGQVHSFHLPGGKAVLFVQSTGDGSLEKRNIAVHSLETGRSKVLFSGTQIHYVSSGHLIYSQAENLGTLLAVPFNLSRLEVEGDPVPIVQNILSTANQGLAQFTTSDDGTLVYIPGGRLAGFDLTWVDRRGNPELLVAPPLFYSNPSLSPNGQRLALTVLNWDSGLFDIWVYDIPRQTRTRLTFEGSNTQPIWTPDGERITWRRSQDASAQARGSLFWKLADGSGEAEALMVSDFRPNPTSWSPDGRLLAFYQRSVGSGSAESGRDIWVLPLEGEREARALLQTQFNESAPMVSPNGRWMAYVSDESGRSEIYVRPFPRLGGKWQISTDGGIEPRWAPDGRELFFRNEAGTKMMVVNIGSETGFSAGTPRLLFEGSYQKGRGRGMGRAFYDITPDGQRFIMVRTAPVGQIHVVQNWHQELKQRIPTN